MDDKISPLPVRNAWIRRASETGNLPAGELTPGHANEHREVPHRAVAIRDADVQTPTEYLNTLVVDPESLQLQGSDQGFYAPPLETAAFGGLLGERREAHQEPAP